MLFVESKPLFPTKYFLTAGHCGPVLPDAFRDRTILCKDAQINSPMSLSHNHKNNPRWTDKYPSHTHTHISICPTRGSLTFEFLDAPARVPHHTEEGGNQELLFPPSLLRSTASCVRCRSVLKARDCWKAVRTTATWCNKMKSDERHLVVLCVPINEVPFRSIQKNVPKHGPNKKLPISKMKVSRHQSQER